MSGHVELIFVTDAARPLNIAGSPKLFARLLGTGPGQPSGRGSPEPGTSRALVNRDIFKINKRNQTIYFYFPAQRYKMLSLRQLTKKEIYI